MGRKRGAERERGEEREKSGIEGRRERKKHGGRKGRN